jgi:integrase
VSLVPRGRAIGARISVHGKKRWVGTFKETCERCHDKPTMCPRCRNRAEAAALEAIERAERSLVWKRETAADFADRWLRDYSRKGQRWDASTIRVYTQILVHFKRRFDTTPLGDIGTAEARSWAQDVPGSYLKCVRTMFNDALEDELITRNPFTGLRFGKEQGRGNIVAITEDELHLLCELATEIHGKHGDTIAAMIAVAGYTAIRPAELFAVEPPDVRLADNELDVRQQWNGHELKKPKGKKVRTVALPSQAAPYLELLPRHLTMIRLPREDGEPVDINPVFRNQKGRIYQGPTFHQTWAPIRSAFEAKLSPARTRELRDSREGKGMNLYELRHFGCTEILRRGGTLEDAAHQLGHTSTLLVERVYGHLEPSVKLDRIKRVYGENVRDIRDAKHGAAGGESG